MSATSLDVAEVALWSWFALTGLSVAYVAYDLITRTPEMKVMKWGWVLVTLYTGPVGLIVYWLSCREPAPRTHETFVAPLWKQAIGSTIHCLAGDATGVIVAAVVAISFVRLPMGVDALVEYVVGFGFGLFVFQALFMKDLLGGSYWQAVRRTWLAEWLSMNAVMAGMVPVMVILMTRDMRAMEPTSMRFWGVMSFATLVGAVLAFPVNRWLVKAGLKHGMGTERALGRGGVPLHAGHDPAPQLRDSHSGDLPKMSGMEMATGARAMASAAWIVALLTIAALAGGVLLAGRYGDLSMRAGDPHEAMPMDMNRHSVSERITR